MIKETTREEMIRLLETNYGFGAEITEQLKIEVLRNTCNSSAPYNYLSALLQLGKPDTYLN